MVMIIIRLLLTLTITIFFGDLLLCSFTRGAKGFYPLERLSIAFPLGLSGAVFIMFFFGILHVPINAVAMFSAVIFFSAMLLIWGLKSGNYSIAPFSSFFKSPALGEIDLNMCLEIFLFFYIGLKVLLAFFSTLIKPVVDVDAIANYALVAKGIFCSQTFTTPYLLGFFEDKPPFPFLDLSWIPIGIGSWNDCLAKGIYPLLYLCFTVIIYYAVRRGASRLYALFFAFLFISLPFIMHHAQTAYADFPQMFFYAAGTIYLFLCMKDFGVDDEKSCDFFFVSMVFLAFAIWVKRGGMYLCGIDALVFLVFIALRKNMPSPAIAKRFGAVLVAAIVVVAPWLIYGRLQTAFTTISLMKSGGGEGGALLDRASVIANVAFTKLFLYADWNLLWACLILSLMICTVNVWRNINVYLLVIVVLNVFALFVQFSSGGSFVWLLQGTLFDRLVMAPVPVVLYFISQVLIDLGADPVLPPKLNEEKRRSGKTKKGH